MHLVVLGMVFAAAGAGAQPPGMSLLRANARGDLPAEITVYEIDQAIDDQGGTFSAQAVVSWTNTTGAPVRELPLLLHSNAAAELGTAPGATGSVTVSEVAATSGPRVTHTVERPTLVRVRFASPVAVGTRVSLRVRYAGRLRQLAPDVNDSFAQAMSSMGSIASHEPSDYGLLAMGDGLVTVASAYPMVAPHRAGSFDDAPPTRLGDVAYNHVAAFRVRTVVPDGFEIVSNLVDTPATAAPGGGRLFRSEGAGVRDFVLVGGRDLQRATRRAGDVTITSVFRARDSASGRLALDVAADSLASLERRFGRYPWTELDVVEASLASGAGGVEFSSLVLIAAMMYRPPDMSRSPLGGLGSLLGGMGQVDSLFQGLPSRPQPVRPATGQRRRGATTPAPAATAPGADMIEGMLEFTVAHEVAHQWFAGIVGNDSHQHPSMDEPLAQYAAALVVEDRRGAADAARAMDLNVKMNYALYRLLGGADQPVDRPITSYRTPIEYAALVYGKAPYAYVTLRRTVGEARLHAAIRTAVERHRFRLVSTADWIATIEAALPRARRAAVRTTFRRWLEQTHGDADLGVDDSGDFVIDRMFPPDMARALRQSTGMLGMQPRDLLRQLFGGGLGGSTAPSGPGIDPDEALRRLLGGATQSP